MDELHPAGADPVGGSGPAATPDFEILPPTGGGPPFHLPTQIKSISAGGVILEVNYPPDGLNLREFQGRGGVVNLPVTGNGSRMAIRGKVQWTRSQGVDNPRFLLGLELEDPSLEVRQALEDQLSIATKDIKELWDQWDRLQEKPKPPPGSSASQGVYLVGMGVVLAGAGLMIFGPDDLKSFGFILVLYGCATLAAKSIWTLWRQKFHPKSQEPMATNR
jgi:hypothetical protein